MDNSKIKIQTKNLKVYYSKFTALKGVSVEIESNKVTSLIGPSGCGKSTFLRSINRMNDVIDVCRIQGQVLVEGINIYDIDVDPVVLRERVGMLFQKANPFPKSIFDNVAYGPRIHGLCRNKSELKDLVIHSLKQVALYDEVSGRLDIPATALSGGQQQRLCLARALAVGPEVILMDEPCSALDPIATAKIEELIDELRDKLTIVIVTHSMSQAKRVSDKTVFFHMGEVIESGPTKDIFSNPKEKLTADYIGGQYG